MATPRTVAFHTLGCKLNYSETSALARLFEDNGYQPVKFEGEADIFVLNTCSVTEQADKECKKIVRQALRRNPGAYIVVTGCYAQLKPQEIAEIEGVDLVLGAGEKFRMLEYIDDLSKSQGKGMVHAGEVRDVNTFTSSFSFGDRTRSFLKVQDGCDYKCSFCTIPQARGASRSDTVEQVVANAQNIGTMGVKEIVLTGVNLGDFGNGTAVIEGEKPRKEALFADLIVELDRVATIERYRISSIEPNLLTEEIIQFVSESKRFMPHFHVPLQSGNDKQLRDMRRRYKRELYADRVTAIRKYMPHACIGCDVIVGFPGETEADFLETYQFLSGLDISYLHVFTYSERANTPAAEMAGAVPMEERKRRNQALRGLSEMKRREFYGRFLNTNRPVLFEQHKNPDFVTGFTDNYIKIEAPFQPELVNSIQMANLQQFDNQGDAIMATPLLSGIKKAALALTALLLLAFLPAQAQMNPDGTLHLKDALQMTLDNSNYIKKAKLDREALTSKFGEQRAAALPQISAGVNFDVFPLLPTQLLPGEVVGRPAGSYVPVQFGRPIQLTGSFTLEQNIYSEAGRRMMPAKQTAESLADLLIERTTEEITYQTASIWYQFLQTAQLQRTVTANMTKLKSLQEMAQLQYNNGYITLTDVKRIKVAVTNLETQQENLLDGLESLRETLQMLCGVPFDQPFQPTGNISMPAADSLTWLAAELDIDASSEMRLLHQQEDLNRTQFHAAKAQNWPSFSAYATGWMQNQRNNPNFFEAKRWYGMGVVGVRAQIPIFDGFRLKNKLAQFQIEHKKILVDFNQLELTKNLEFRQSRRQLKNALRLLETQEANKALAREVADKQLLRYKSGEVPLSDVLTAETAYAEAETNYWQQVFTYKIAVLRLAKATGRLSTIELN